MEHRSSTRMRHLTLFCAVPFASFHVRCFLSNSVILVRRQVCWGLPLFRFHCGLHSSALLTTCPSGLLNVWPIHPQALCLISWSIGRYPVCLQSSLLLIFLGHQIPKMFLGLLLMNTCNFCSNLLVSFHVSEPYKSTTFTYEPKTLSLVLVVSAVPIAIFVSASQMPVLLFQFVPECPRQCLPSCLQCSQGMWSHPLPQSVQLLPARKPACSSLNFSSSATLMRSRITLQNTLLDMFSNMMPHQFLQ